MKKNKLMTIAMLGISSGILLTGCQKTDNRRDQRDNRPGSNTAAAEQPAPVAVNQSCGGGCGGQQQPIRGQQSQGQGGYYDAGQAQRNNYNNQMYQGQNPQGTPVQGQNYQGQQNYHQH